MAKQAGWVLKTGSSYRVTESPHRFTFFLTRSGRGLCCWVVFSAWALFWCSSEHWIKAQPQRFLLRLPFARKRSLRCLPLEKQGGKWTLREGSWGHKPKLSGFDMVPSWLGLVGFVFGHPLGPAETRLF